MTNKISVLIFTPSSHPTGTRQGPGPDPLFNNQRHKRLPGSRWEVSPGYHLWGERKSGEQNALPLLVTGDRQARKPANDGVPHTAVEVLTELANDLVSGAANRIPRGPLHIPPGGSRKVAAARTCGTTLPAYTRQHSSPRAHRQPAGGMSVDEYR